VIYPGDMIRVKDPGGSSWFYFTPELQSDDTCREYFKHEFVISTLTGRSSFVDESSLFVIESTTGFIGWISAQFVERDSTR